MKVVTKEILEELLQEREDMCNCGCGWGNEDGHEWEILFLEKLLNEYIVEIKDTNNDNS